jgi:hypothetical protein
MPLPFLSAADAARAARTLRKLAPHDIRNWALAGGMAMEIHSLARRPSTRALNDLDFVAPSFDSIPGSLANDFLFRHVHPLDPPGKLILQFIDPDTALRIDVFRAYGEIMRRTIGVDLPCGSMQLVSLVDLVARAARLVLDLADGVPVPAKHARDYLRLVELADPAEVETAWQDHRRPPQPATFCEARGALRNLIAARANLLITPEYSQNTAEICSRCAHNAAFPVADPKAVLALLGYC